MISYPRTLAIGLIAFSVAAASCTAQDQPAQDRQQNEQSEQAAQKLQGGLAETGAASTKTGHYQSPNTARPGGKLMGTAAIQLV